jgi:hypothetical protein
MKYQFEAMTVDELLGLYVEVLRELMRRGTIRTNNLTGEIAERVVADCLHLEVSPSSNAGYDAVDKDGVRYQIKSRRITARNKSTQLGYIKIKHVSEKLFDYLVGILFDEDFTVRRVVRIPPLVIPEFAGIKGDAYKLHLQGALLADPRVQDISDLFARDAVASL